MVYPCDSSEAGINPASKSRSSDGREREGPTGDDARRLRRSENSRRHPMQEESIAVHAASSCWQVGLAPLGAARRDFNLVSTEADQGQSRHGNWLTMPIVTRSEEMIFPFQHRWAAGLMLLMLLTGCDYYAKPNRPVPEQFEAMFLDGGVLNRFVLSGKPWVISIWVPG